MTAVDARTSQDPFILRVENLSKRYGSLVALRDVSLAVRRGTIHGLLGENGAGKSTLVSLISGQRQPSSGTISLDGVAITDADVKEMERAGVFLVTQEPMIIDHLTAAENLMLGIWPTKRGFVDWRRLRGDAARMLAGSGIEPQAQAGRLDAVARRKLNILRAMFSGGKVIILDEPTAALTVADRAHLFAFMRELKSRGVTFIFISHYNDEILEICDACSVLRDGVLAGGTENVDTLTSEQLSELVLGRGLVLFQRQRRDFADAAPAVRLRDVVGEGVQLAKFDLHAGEIVGFTGLPGSGAKAFVRAVFGLAPVHSGTIQFGDAPAHRLPADPGDAFDAGIAFLSDDRRRDGLVAHMTIGENISLSSLSAVANAGFLRADAEQALAARYFKAMDIKASDPSAVVDTLSGGNQQKVCLGRVLATQPRLLILDEPTRGIDIGVKQDVLRIIDELSRSGVAVIIVSTDTDEIVRAVDRVCVFDRGTIREEISGDAISSERLRQRSASRAGA